MLLISVENQGTEFDVGEDISDRGYDINEGTKTKEHKVQGTVNNPGWLEGQGIYREIVNNMASKLVR